MGGDFTVNSELGQGTTFSFTMHLAPMLTEFAGDHELDFADVFNQLDLGGKRILIAEDNEINQYLLVEMLKPTGAELLVVENGKLAVDAAKTQKIDMVLMDVQMPVMDGIQASREIREFADKEELPIIAVTANALKDDKREGLLAGVNDYITKPIEPAYLGMALKQWIK